MIRYRRMTEEDLGQVAANELYAYAFPWTEGIFRDCLKAGQDCWVALLDDRIVGHGVVSIGAGEGHLLNVCIRRDEQGKGFGRALVLQLLQAAHSGGASVVYLEVRPSNHVAGALYDSLGFTEVGVRKNYYPALTGHEDARVLVIDLNELYGEDAG